jgi:hypothetical protein
MVQEMFDTIILIQPKGSSGGSDVTREEIVYNTATELLDKLPLLFNMFELKERFYNSGKKIIFSYKSLFFNLF